MDRSRETAGQLIADLVLRRSCGNGTGWAKGWTPFLRCMLGCTHRRPADGLYVGVAPLSPKSHHTAGMSVAMKRYPLGAKSRSPLVASRCQWSGDAYRIFAKWATGNLRRGSDGPVTSNPPLLEPAWVFLLRRPSTGFLQSAQVPSYCGKSSVFLSAACRNGSANTGLAKAVTPTASSRSILDAGSCQSKLSNRDCSGSTGLASSVQLVPPVDAANESSIDGTDPAH
jgi:hypothetical protein